MIYAAETTQAITVAWLGRREESLPSMMPPTLSLFVAEAGRVGRVCRRVGGRKRTLNAGREGGQGHGERG
jgi:hypothetical protein